MGFDVYNLCNCQRTIDLSSTLYLTEYHYLHLKRKKEQQTCIDEMLYF